MLQLIRLRSLNNNYCPLHKEDEDFKRKAFFLFPWKQIHLMKYRVEIKYLNSIREKTQIFECLELLFNYVARESTLKSRIPKRLLRLFNSRVANNCISRLRFDLKVSKSQSALQVCLNRINFRFQMSHRVQLTIINYIVVSFQFIFETFLEHPFRAAAAEHHNLLSAFCDFEYLQNICFT